MKAIIKSPVEDYMGISASVAFANGKAEADISESQLEYFESAGYKVTILKANKAEGKGEKSAKELKTDGTEGKKTDSEDKTK